MDDRIARDSALVLRFAPYSNTSRLVTWLTRGHGRITTLVKGSQRPKSFFLGQYDLGHTCELLFYRRDRGGVHHTRECAPLDARAWLRDDWRAGVWFSYLSDVVVRTVPPDAPLPGAFDLAAGALDLARGAPFFSVLQAWFELHWLDLLGLAPRLSACAGCGVPLRDLAPDREVRLSARNACVRCDRCAEDAGPGDIACPAPSAGRLVEWQGCRAPDLWTSNASRSAAPAVLLRWLGDLLSYHLDTPSTGREAFTKWMIAGARLRGRTAENGTG